MQNAFHFLFFLIRFFLSLMKAAEVYTNRRNNLSAKVACYFACLGGLAPLLEPTLKQTVSRKDAKDRKGKIADTTSPRKTFCIHAPY
jgi:hypothetical protein